MKNLLLFILTLGILYSCDSDTEYSTVYIYHPTKRVELLHSEGIQKVDYSDEHADVYRKNQVWNNFPYPASNHDKEMSDGGYLRIYSDYDAKEGYKTDQLILMGDYYGDPPRRVDMRSFLPNGEIVGEMLGYRNKPNLAKSTYDEWIQKGYNDPNK